MPMFKRLTLPFGSRKPKPKPTKEIKNIVIFGETGVGKSSLINLIANKRISETSSSAAGCTLTYTRHLVLLDNEQFALWDTAGLGEGSQGSVPAEKAEAYLKQLLHDLAEAQGIDLLVYCVRGTRVRSALLAHYHLFYSAICRKKVPIAIVITGLENQEGNMDTWWLTNEPQFSELRMYFDNYACVTTLESSMENPVLRERRKISRTALIKMIKNTCRTERWRPTVRSWMETAFSDIRAILSPRDGHVPHVANVIMCNISQRAPNPLNSSTRRSFTLQNPVSLSRFPTRQMSIRSPVSVVDQRLQNKLPFCSGIKGTSERLFRVYQVPRKQILSTGKDETRHDMAVRRGADLLVFCVKEDEECWDVRAQWDHFNLTYGGDLSPQIVVILGARDQRSAEKWWDDAVGASKHGEPYIAYFPMNGSTAEAEVAKGRLQDLINTRCIDCSEANFAGHKQIFRRATSPMSEKSLARMWIGPVGRKNKVDVPVPVDQDILTTLGVWDHISDR